MDHFGLMFILLLVGVVGVGLSALSSHTPSRETPSVYQPAPRAAEEEWTEGEGLTVLVRGGRWPGPDGTDRQAAYRSLRAGQPLTLVREPDNPKDPDAVAVLNLEPWAHLGYLPASMAARHSPAMLRGERSTCHVLKVVADKYHAGEVALLIDLVYG